jgi:hypothetical protein
MPRINPNSFATKAIAMSDAMSDELIAPEDVITAAKKARDVYLAASRAERKRRERVRDTVTIARSKRRFSLFADTSRDPK